MNRRRTTKPTRTKKSKARGATHEYIIELIRECAERNVPAEAIFRRMVALGFLCWNGETFDLVADGAPKGIPDDSWLDAKQAIHAALVEMVGGPNAAAFDQDWTSRIIRKLSGAKFDDPRIGFAIAVRALKWGDEEDNQNGIMIANRERQQCAIGIKDAIRRTPDIFQKHDAEEIGRFVIENYTEMDSHFRSRHRYLQQARPTTPRIGYSTETLNLLRSPAGNADDLKNCGLANGIGEVAEPTLSELFELDDIVSVPNAPPTSDFDPAKSSLEQLPNSQKNILQAVLLHENEPCNFTAQGAIAIWVDGPAAHVARYKKEIARLVRRGFLTLCRESRRYHLTDLGRMVAMARVEAVKEKRVGMI